jgi:hypothetical protein
MEAQCKKIKAYLESGHTLTPLEALEYFDCLRLGARIYDLNKNGVLFKCTLIKTRSGKYVGQYSKI